MFIFPSNRTWKDYQAKITGFLVVKDSKWLRSIIRMHEVLVLLPRSRVLT